MTLLDTINSPKDLRKLDRKQLHELADEIRHRIIEVVSKIGGHFGGNLGIVELTLALHYVFNTPRDQIVFDTGHQTYPHKLITGRRDTFETIRMHGGISGFCKREESEYDVFNAGHASTSISAALGIAVARDIKDENYRVVAIIGDGALSGGLALEGLNQAGHLKRKLLIVLVNTDPRNPEELGAPFYHAAVAAAMDYEVDVICAATAGKLMRRGVAEAIRIKPGHAKTVYDWIRDAHKNGARFWACPANLDLFDMTEADLIPECKGLMGAAAMLQNIMSDDYRVLTY